MKNVLVYFALFLLIQDTMRYSEIKAMPMQTTVVIDFTTRLPDATMPPPTTIPTTPDATTSSTTSTTTTTTTTTTPSPPTTRKGRGKGLRDKTQGKKKL